MLFENAAADAVDPTANPVVDCARKPVAKVGFRRITGSSIEIVAEKPFPNVAV
jgi:hypothetical protein